jgi:hypothetical protein
MRYLDEWYGTLISDAVPWWMIRYLDEWYGTLMSDTVPRWVIRYLDKWYGTLISDTVPRWVIRYLDGWYGTLGYSRNVRRVAINWGPNHGVGDSSHGRSLGSCLGAATGTRLAPLRRTQSSATLGRRYGVHKSSSDPPLCNLPIRHVRHT